MWPAAYHPYQCRIRTSDTADTPYQAYQTFWHGPFCQHWKKLTKFDFVCWSKIFVFWRNFWNNPTPKCLTRSEIDIYDLILVLYVPHISPLNRCLIYSFGCFVLKTMIFIEFFSVETFLTWLMFQFFSSDLPTYLLREPDNWSHGHLIPCHFCQTGRLVPSSFARLDVWSHPIFDKVDN